MPEPTRAIVVQKYGGSSLADTAKLTAVAKRVVELKRSGKDVVVVVSAMGKTTDGLLSLAREVAAEPSRRELDMLLSVGERISMALMSMAIHGLGEEAISLTGSQCGILTTDSHSRARIMEVRPFRVQDELAKGRIVIVAGYQGTSYKREITTLGRGGSDVTAVALAGALAAEACEIYSDVDGVLTADPRVVPSATKIELLSHAEMEEMARLGAKVLHRDAVAWARRTGVALWSRSTFTPESKGTEVRVNPPPRPTPVVAIASRRDVIALDSNDEEAIEALLVDVPVAGRIAGSGGTSWLLTREDTHEIGTLCLRAEQAGAQVTRELGSVSVIGGGLGEDRQVYDAIRQRFAAVPSVLGGMSWTAYFPVDAIDDIVRDLHDSLLSGS